MEYKEVQGIARETIKYIKKKIKPGMNLKDVRNLCEQKMLSLGADSFWYWNVGAFVFAGDETTLSISGKHYQTADRLIQNNDIVTIDLSPQNHHIWGDYARTIIIEDGKVIDDINMIKNEEWKNGLLMEEKLHQEMRRFVTVDTTFEQLYSHINAFIQEHGYVNLDFLGNLGHSIVQRSEDRIYIEKGNTKKLSEVSFFTFEPHISKPQSQYGFKKENIYYFKNHQLMKL